MYIEPLPVPVDPEVIVNQLASLTPDHPHPAPSVTTTRTLWLAASILTLLELSDELHEIPVWLIVNTWPLTEIVPVRGAELGFEKTPKRTVPVPAGPMM